MIDRDKAVRLGENFRQELAREDAVDAIAIVVRDGGHVEIIASTEEDSVGAASEHWARILVKIGQAMRGRG